MLLGPKRSLNLRATLAFYMSRVTSGHAASTGEDLVREPAYGGTHRIGAVCVWRGELLPRLQLQRPGALQDPHLSTAQSLCCQAGQFMR